MEAQPKQIKAGARAQIYYIYNVSHHNMLTCIEQHLSNV